MSLQVWQIEIKEVCVCVGMRGQGGREGGEHCGQGRIWCRGRGKVFVARGMAGLTGQQQRRLVPPGFLLKTRPPPRPAHFAPASFLSPLPPLSPSLFSLLLLFIPSFTLQSLLLAPFFSLLSSISLTSSGFFAPLHVWAITDTQQRAERWGCVAEVVGWGIWGGTKAPRCSGPTRVAGFEKKPDGFLMQRVDGQTRIDTQSSISPLSSSFNWCLFWSKKAHHPTCALPATHDVLSNTLRCGARIGGGRERGGRKVI